MEVIAVAKHIPQSPKKIRVVAKAVTDLSPQEAIASLEHVKKRAAQPLRKVIQSALANAENNHDLNPANMEIKEIQVGDSRTRRQPEFRARGRLNWRLNRSSHIRVVLQEREDK